MLSILDLNPGSALSRAGMGCLALAVCLLIPGLLYLLTLQRALGRISPEHRCTEPAKVWLLAIPVMGLVWHFWIVNKLTQSFKKAYHAQGLEAKDPRFGMVWGMLFCIVSPLLMVTPVVRLLFPTLPWLPWLLGLWVLAAWIIWWLKVLAFSRKMTR